MPITKLTSNAQIAEVLAQLAGVSIPKYEDVEIERSGTKIIMPEGMSHEDAIEWHNRKIREEQETVGIYEVVYAYPLDGALALMKALRNRFGWTSLQPTPGFWSEHPPVMIGLKVSATETVQVAWGRIAIPNVSGYIDMSVEYREGRSVLVLKGQTKMRDRELFRQIANDVRSLVRTESIYRGQAIRVEFPDADQEEDFNPTKHMPEFLDTTKTRPDELIFSQELHRVLTTTLWTPIEKTELCRTALIPLKRGILLEGPFGVGKTMTANVTARKAVENRWTFIYLEDVRRLHEAMLFAQTYQPAVIFTEDIDRADEYGQRDDTMNTILNTIDGVEMKSSEIIVVLTTNNVERITKAMLRPGRLDAVVSLRAPDAAAVERLIRLYSRDMLADDQNLADVSERLAGQIPAVVREVVERAKLAAISRGDVYSIVAEDLSTATAGMMYHLELMRVPQPDVRSDIEKAAEIVATGIASIGAVREMNGH